MYDKHCSSVRYVVFLLFYDPPTTAFYTSCHTLALHDALPISMAAWLFAGHHRRPGAERVDGRPVLAREVGRAQQARRETLPDQPALAETPEGGKPVADGGPAVADSIGDRKSTRLNSSH